MSFSIWGRDPPVSIDETVALFHQLARPLIAKGDLDGVKTLYREAYAQVMKGRKQQLLEARRARVALEQALTEELTRSARERRRYFAAYQGDWWRHK